VKKSDFPAKLRSDPLTDDEINYFNHLKTLDLKRLVKLLPAWARTKKVERAAEFIAGQKPHYPGWTGARAMAAAEFKFPSPHITDPAEYIAEFKRLNGPYKNPCTIRLIQNPREKVYLVQTADGPGWFTRDSYRSGAGGVDASQKVALKQAKKAAHLYARQYHVKTRVVVN
jgi:hypothetical protein